jgi:transposase InsO family protein
VRDLGWTVTSAAEAAGISRRTAHKWLARHSTGEALNDRSSRPKRSPHRTPVEWQQMILLLRRTKMTGPQIARELKRPKATVARVLKRAGLDRLKKLETPEPPNRYEHRRPGSLVHLDVKKLGRISGFIGHRITGDRTKSRSKRGAGWDYVHVAIDDRTRIAYAEVLRDETAETTIGFLQRARAWYRTLGIRVRRILTDNGSNYIARRFAHEAERLRITHKRTRPYRPRTNGKAERFIQTLIREWAYAVPYLTSKLRSRALPRWLGYYNRSRPHGSLHGLPPFSRMRPRVRTTS